LGGGLEGYTLAVDVRVLDDLDAAYGFVFSLIDWERFCTVMIWPSYDTAYVGCHTSTGWTDGTWVDPTLAIHSGTAVNHIQVTRFGPWIDVYINDVPVMTEYNDRYLGNLAFGLYAQSGTSTAPATVRFDNFALWDWGAESGARREGVTAGIRLQSDARDAHDEVEGLRLSLPDR
jgi:hypothetical protein